MLFVVLMLVTANIAIAMLQHLTLLFLFVDLFHLLDVV